MDDAVPFAPSLRLDRVLGSPRFRGGQFRNTLEVAPGLKGNPLPVMGEYFFGRGTERVPRRALPVQDPRPGWARPAESGLRMTWLGHSTVLLEIDGVRVLTDPVFGIRASPVGFAGPKRFHAPPVTIAQLPRLDAVLLSHDHYDHLCKQSARELAALGVPFVTSLGVGSHLESYGVAASNIHELDWWESYTLPGGRLSFTAAPAQHFSGRGLGDRNHTLWSSWVMRGPDHRVFFSGDTGLTEEFRDIGQKLGPFDLTMLEIGAWNEAWGDIHLGPANALEAFAMLGGGTLLPVHWGTFNLALHAWDEPAETLYGLAGGRRLLLPQLGQVMEPARVEQPEPWWRR